MIAFLFAVADFCYPMSKCKSHFLLRSQASILPFLEKTSWLTEPQKSSTSCSCFKWPPFTTFQVLIMASSDPDARIRPLGKKTIDLTAPMCSCIVLGGSCSKCQWSLQVNIAENDWDWGALHMKNTKHHLYRYVRLKNLIRKAWHILLIKIKMEKHPWLFQHVGRAHRFRIHICRANALDKTLQVVQCIFAICKCTSYLLPFLIINMHESENPGLALTHRLLHWREQGLLQRHLLREVKDIWINIPDLLNQVKKLSGNLRRVNKC